MPQVVSNILHPLNPPNPLPPSTWPWPPPPPTPLPATALCISFRGSFLPHCCSFTVWCVSKMHHHLSSVYIGTMLLWHHILLHNRGSRCFTAFTALLRLFEISVTQTHEDNGQDRQFLFFVAVVVLLFCLPALPCLFSDFGQLLAFGSFANGSLFSTLTWLTLLRKKHLCRIMKMWTDWLTECLSLQLTSREKEND